MKNIIYSIDSFKWEKGDNSFYANEVALYTSEGDFKCTFPNGKRQLYIKNYKTGNFRRFRFLKEKDTTLEYISEDNIYCKIYIHKDRL